MINLKSLDYQIDSDTKCKVCGRVFAFHCTKFSLTTAFQYNKWLDDVWEHLKGCREKDFERIGTRFD